MIAPDVAETLADLVGAIGDARFPGCFHGAVSALADVALCSAFRHESDGAVRLLFAQGALPLLADFPIRASLDYARSYWRSDQALLRRSRTGRTMVLRTRAQDIADPAYRYACYERAGVRERLSLCAGSLVANGYRMTDAEPFSPEEIARVEAHAGLLMAMLARHDRASAAAPQDEAALMQSLLALHCGLSAREAEVSAAMMLGETQAEIAARKRLSPDSVVTYRRRAYGKLGIANRRDLVKLHRRLAGGA